MGSLRRSDLVALLILLCVAALPRHARAVAFVQSIVQICQEGDNCETGAPVMVPDQPADMSRAWNPGPGFSYAASVAISTSYVAWSAFARGSGLENPEGSGTTFISLVSRGGRAYGHVHDTITAGTGGGSGFLRLPLHLVGNTSISWQNGFGGTSFSVSCSSSVPGTPIVVGVCDAVSANFTNNADIDQEANLDIPIILGSPVYFVASLSAGAGTGHLYGDLIPFVGQAEITVATLPFEGAIVLDASRQPIPGATVSVAESGFDYNAPEAPSLLGAAAAVGTLGLLRQRRR